MALIAGLGPVLVSPGRPLVDVVFQKQLSQGLPIVYEHFVAGVFLVAKQLEQVFLELVSPAFLKLLEQLWRPVGLVNLILVVEERVRIWRAALVESIFKPLQVVGNSVVVEVVYHVTFATGCSPFHLLTCA